MVKQFTDEDEALLAELGVDTRIGKATQYTPREERIIAGFEEIQKFFETHGRSPENSEDRDIFERIYAVRLNRIREQDECRILLGPMDHQGLVTVNAEESGPELGVTDDAALLAELGVSDEGLPITELRHVRSTADKRNAKEVASRRQCKDYDDFRELFTQVQRDLDVGLRETRRFQDNAEIEAGQFFVLGGQKVYVAEMGTPFTKQYGDSDARRDARLRVIYDNGTESDLLMRSLQRALNKDEGGRRIIDSAEIPLFDSFVTDDDKASGTVYVLRSKSDHPYVQENYSLIHKIGVTGNDLKRRIAKARQEATFLMADVEVVATYRLYNINLAKLENLIHRVFSAARLQIEIHDRFGNPVVPREWFLVPLHVIDEAVGRIRDETITEYTYCPETASLSKGTTSCP